MLKTLAWLGGLVILPLALFALLTTLPFTAQAQGEPGHIIIGTAKGNGSPVPAGSTVTAWDGDSQIGSATTREGGHFDLQVSRPSGVIRFKVNGVFANETHPWWQSGGITGSDSNRFILTVGESDPDATPWPTPTPTPTLTPTPTAPYITSSATSGPPGTYVGIVVGNFKSSVPVRSLFIGGVDVLPGPAFETNAQGTTYVDFLIPGLAAGDYAIEADVGGDAASVNFTVTDPDCPLAAGTPSPSITLSRNRGVSGTFINISGSGFKGFMPVSSVVVASIDHTPVPVPWTNCVGEIEIHTLIPDLPLGRYPIEVEVAGSTARVDYTVTPPPTLTLSANRGAPGSTITLRGENFAPLVPVQEAYVDWIDVLPSPAPQTDAQGTTEFDIRIPDLALGIQHIMIQAWDVVYVEFTVTAASAPTPTPRPTATPYPTPTPTPYPTAAPTPAPTAEPPQLPGDGNEPPHIFAGQATLNGSPAEQGVAIDAYDAGRRIGATVTQSGGQFSIHVHRAEGVITFRVNNQAAAESWTAWRQGQVTTGFNLTAGGVNSRETDPGRLFAALPDLVRAFNFDNATKRWSFFDPAAAEVSTLTRFIPQHPYWLLVSHSTRLLLNGVERDLFCVADNCWNIIVW